jgi:hypothetical protein
MKRTWASWVVRIGLGVVAVFVLLCAAAFILNPTAAILLAGMLLQPLSSNTHPPPIVNDASGWQYEDELTRVLQRQFPAGTEEAAVKKALLAQGFKPLTPPPEKCVPRGQIGPVGRTVYPCPSYDLDKALEYRWSSGICGETIRVWWKIGEGGAITQISGHYGRGCL